MKRSVSSTARTFCDFNFLFCIYNNLIIMGKSELKWTAYNKYLTTELRQQILNLTEVVKQFTTLKCLHQHESEPVSMPLFDDDLDFLTLNSEAVASLVSFYSSLPPSLRKQPHPVKSPLNLSFPSWAHSVKATKKTCRSCFLPQWFH